MMLQDTGLYYDRYLREVIEVLETDPHFREKLQTANAEDIRVCSDVLENSRSLFLIALFTLRICLGVFFCVVAVLHQNGHLSNELDLVSHHVRTRLDELKRQEVSRLRMLLKAKVDSTNSQSTFIRPHFWFCNLFYVGPVMKL